MTTTDRITPFITFYSFKGGVGRSMAVVNTASLMAERGFRVLVIDMDLEAPGLSYLLREAGTRNGKNETPSQVGLIDLLLDAKQRGMESDLFGRPVAAMLEIYCQRYSMPQAKKKSPSAGEWNIMPAGRLDEDYSSRLVDLNLSGLYEEGLGEPLIRSFKKKIAESGLYDFVLVDSRTGFSDEAGICTRDLADYLMILSGLNKQNVEGTSGFLGALRDVTEGSARFQIILSPVPNGEDDLVAKRKKAAQLSFSQAWGQSVSLDLQIPYHPRLALTEEPHIYHQKSGFLTDAYRKIERQVYKGVGLDPEEALPTLIMAVMEKDYQAVLLGLERYIKLDEGKQILANFIMTLFLPARIGIAGGFKDRPTLEQLLAIPAGKGLVTFLVEHASCDPNEMGMVIMLNDLTRNDLELAELAFQRLLKAHPKDARIWELYAEFCHEEKHDLEAAKYACKRAIDIGSKNALLFCSYASLLLNSPDYYDQANSFYLRGLKLKPKDAHILGNYAVFLAIHRGDLEQAQVFYLRALEADPKHAGNLGNYAVFLETHLGDLEQAQAFYLRALEADPKHAINLGNYAHFLATHRGDLEQAQAFYLRALEADPKHTNNLINLGQLLLGNGDFQQGEQHLLEGLKYVSPTDIKDLAETCLALWLAFRLQGKDGRVWLQGYKFYLQQGFPRYLWTFDRILAQAEKRFSPQEFSLAQALAAAFLDVHAVAKLNLWEEWQTLEAKAVK